MSNRRGSQIVVAVLLVTTSAVVAAVAWPEPQAEPPGATPSVTGVSDDHGSIRSIRGIEGIDSVMLQNLEVVLRMQDRPQENQGKGGASTAARLMAREMAEPLEELPDAREEHLEFELEGS